MKAREYGELSNFVHSLQHRNLPSEETHPGSGVTHPGKWGTSFLPKQATTTMSQPWSNEPNLDRLLRRATRQLHLTSRTYQVSRSHLRCTGALNALTAVTCSCSILSCLLSPHFLSELPPKVLPLSVENCQDALPPVLRPHLLRSEHARPQRQRRRGIPPRTGPAKGAAFLGWLHRLCPAGQHSRDCLWFDVSLPSPNYAHHACHPPSMGRLLEGLSLSYWHRTFCSNMTVDNVTTKLHVEL